MYHHHHRSHHHNPHNHPTPLTAPSSSVHRVVTVGGDGLYCEVMNGIILRTQTDHGVHVHDREARVVPSRLPIGIIPAGTGDMVVQYLHGTRDVMTAALRIVLGGSLPTNAVSVHQGGQLAAYSGLLLAFGLQGDMMADCEKFRWMGQSRYNGECRVRAKETGSGRGARGRKR